MANYREPQWLLPNEKNLAMPASDATVGSGLAEDRQSLYSMDFDGTDYIDLGTDLDIFRYNINESYSVSLWYKATVAGGFKTIINLGANNYRFCLLSATLGRITFGAGNSSTVTVTYNWMPTAGAINDGNWHHICIVQDSSGGVPNLTAYVDGSSSGSGAGTTPAITQNNNRIGDGHYGGVEAGIDEVAIFNYALNATEVAALSVNNAPANVMALSAKPYAYYPLGEQARLGSEWQFPNEVLQSHVFDFAASDFIQADSLNISGAISGSCWFKTSENSSRGVLIAEDDLSTNRNWTFRRKNTSVECQLRFSSSTVTIETTGINISDNNWHNAIFTWNGTTNTDSFKIFIDGVLRAKGTPTQTVLETDDTNLKISDSNTSYDFIGSLSNVQVWDAGLTFGSASSLGDAAGGDIATIYNNGSPYAGTQPQVTNLKAWYKLNATSNYAGLNPNFHNALDFVASESDYIDFGDITDLDGSAALTLSTWVKPTASGTSSADGIIAKDGATRGFYLATFTSDKFRFFISTNGTTSDSFNSNLAYTTNEWYHLAATWDGSNIKLYINGSLDTTQAVSNATGTLSDNSNTLRIGNNGGSGYLNGVVSNTAIYNQAISAEDVLYLYNGGTPQTNISFEPTSWYKLDNLTTGIQDSGSASNNGTNNGATAVSSSVAVDQWNFDNVSQAQTPNYSSALDFDGTNDYIDCGNDSSLQISQNISISVWLRCTDQGIIFSKGQYAGETAAAGFNYSLSVRSPGYGLAWQWYTTSSDGSSTGNRIYYLATTGKALTVIDGLWHNIVVTRSASSSKLYLDGEYIASTGNTATDLDYMVNSSQNVRIGDASNGIDPFPGDISNVQVWNTQLTDADALSIYNNGQPSTTAVGSPISWWKLDNTTTGVQDSGSASNNGTNNGATEIQTNVWTPRLNGESTTLPSTALVSSDLQFESPYSNFSLKFDGTDQYIATANTFLNSASVCTISFWCKLDSATDSIAIGDYISSFNGIAINYAGTYNLIRFRTMNGGNVFTDATLTGDTNWHNIVCVYEGGVSAKIYADGILLSTNTTSIPATLPATTGDDFRIGTDSNTVYSTGKIDETAIWSSALTQAQISQVYNNGYPSDLTSLSPVSWWRLGEDAYFVSPNFTVPNQITGAPNGTSQNMDQADLVADAPGSYASGVGSSLVVTDRIGDAPESTANSLSFNMTPLNKISYSAGYVPTQADNVYSMAFDGVNDYFISTLDGTGGSGSIIGLNSAADLSVSLWFKSSNTTPTGVGIFQWANALNSGMPFIMIRQGTPGTVANVYVDNQYVVTNKPIVADTWYHITVTRSASDSIWRIYFDGEQYATHNDSGTPNNQSNADSIYLGNAYNGYFPGNIDEVAIFNYALSARQIKQDIYNGTTTGKTADLNNISNLTAPVAWYRMGD